MTSTPALPARDERYGWYVVFVLILAYTVSYIDRTILTLLVDPIRRSLHISDVQVSLLHGLAFAIFYTALGLPIGRLIDRRRRTTIVAGGIVLWSAMTALCGLSRSFGQMFLARVGVGVGEATLSPAAYSLLADYFPPHKLTRALSVYTGAMYIGAGLAMIAGGSAIASIDPMALPVLGHLEAWQVVFLLVSLPGLVVAVLVAFLREPPRYGVVATAAGTAQPVRALLQYLRDRGRAYGLLIAGFSTASLAWNGMSAWIPTFFIRGYGWSTAQVGLSFGSVLLVCGTAGIVTGGMLVGRLRTRGSVDANLRIGIVSALAAAPFGVIAPFVHIAPVALGLFAGFVFFAAMPYGGAAAALQEITPNQMRGQVSALYLLGLNLAGIGFGPTLVALLGERVFGTPQGLAHALSLVALVAFPLSALLLWRGCAPYRAALARNAF